MLYTRGWGCILLREIIQIQCMVTGELLQRSVSGKMNKNVRRELDRIIYKFMCEQEKLYINLCEVSNNC